MLENCSWNQTEAAERFHIPLSTLNQKIKRLNIEIKKKSERVAISVRQPSSFLVARPDVQSETVLSSKGLHSYATWAPGAIRNDKV